MSDLPGAKDGNGQFLPPPKADRSAIKELDRINPLPPIVVPKEELDANALLLQGLGMIHEIMYRIHLRIRQGSDNREDHTTLKDCMVMLHELRKQGLADASKLAEDELGAIASKND